MTYIKKPSVSHPNLPKNSLGLTRRDYEGGLSTLCAGCGHDSVTAAIIQACFELEVEPYQVGKMSGIGCSSKTPGYFLSQAHGFNSVHGRMPSVTTGANAAHRDMVYLGVSGDGDTGSIGFGQFAHAIRRRLNMLYIIENNGVYGLTKGQFSALADQGAVSKRGDANGYGPIDSVQFAIQMGAGFVARSFSGDRKQLVNLIKAGLSYKGFALIDVISPCVTFNNHEGSTRSYSHTRSASEVITEVDYVMEQSSIEIESTPGQGQEVQLHDGSKIFVKSLDEGYNPSDARAAMNLLEDHQSRGIIATGLVFCQKEAPDFHDLLGTVKTPLRDIPFQKLCPGSDALSRLNSEFR